MPTQLVNPGAQALAADLNQVALPLGFWDLAGIATQSVSGGTINGNGPLGRNAGDYWQCTATGQTLIIDLGSSHSVAGVGFGTFPVLDATKIPAGFAVDYSTDGSTWTNLATVSNNARTALTLYPVSNNQIATFTARYLRLTVTAFQSGQSVANIAGFAVWSGENAAGFGSEIWFVDASGRITTPLALGPAVIKLIAFDPVVTLLAAALS